MQIAKCELFGGPRDGEVIYLPLPNPGAVLLPVLMKKDEIVLNAPESFLTSATCFDWYDTINTICANSEASWCVYRGVYRGRIKKEAEQPLLEELDCYFANLGKLENLG